MIVRARACSARLALGRGLEAAIAVTTGAVNAMRAAPKIGCAGALRWSISTLAGRGGRFAHPSLCAPFVLVGKGEMCAAQCKISSFHQCRPMRAIAVCLQSGNAVMAR